jgi:hypothetical protein
MKKISNFIDVNKLLSGEEKKMHDQKHYEQETAKIVNNLFGELKLIFPAFRQAWATDEEFSKAKSVWTKALKENGISNIGMIKRALQKCRLSTNPFAPSVGQFIEWCKASAEDIKFPEILEAHRQSLKMNELYSEYKNPDERVDKLVRHVIAQIGPTQYRKLTEKESYKIFGYYYTVAVRQYANGELPDIDKALESDAAKDREEDDIKGVIRDEYKKLRGHGENMIKIKELLLRR